MGSRRYVAAGQLALVQGTIPVIAARARTGVVFSGPQDGTTCLSCSAPVVHTDAGFLHVGPDCQLSSENFHDLFVEIFAAALESKISSSTAFAAPWECPVCLEWSAFDLAPAGGTVLREAQWGSKYRPDLQVLSPDGSVHCIVEVVVSHEPTSKLMGLYRDARLPVMRVWPSWEGLGALCGSLTRDFASKPSTPISSTARVRHRNYGFVLENVTCSSVRHPMGGTLTCSTCLSPATEMSAEVVGGSCYKCAAYLPVLDLLIPVGTGLQRLAPSNPDIPKGVDLVAAAMGVHLRLEHSRTSSSTYLMHHCPECSTPQGNWYLSGHSDTVREVDLGTPRRTYKVCPDGHWELLKTTPWPGSSEAEVLYESCQDDPECTEDLGPCGRCPRRARFTGAGSLDWGD